MESILSAWPPQHILHTDNNPSATPTLPLSSLDLASILLEQNILVWTVAPQDQISSRFSIWTNWAYSFEDLIETVEHGDTVNILLGPLLQFDALTYQLFGLGLFDNLGPGKIFHIPSVLRVLSRVSCSKI